MSSDEDDEAIEFSTGDRGALTVGKRTNFESGAIEPPFMCVFEDDEEAGFFYAVDMTIEEQPIRDSMEIYKVSDMEDKERSRNLVMGWSLDGKACLLMIDGEEHAIFDFEKQQGYCKSGFPPPSGAWEQDDHKWSEEALSKFVVKAEPVVKENDTTQN